MEETTRYEQARRRVEAIRSFNIHAAIYVTVNLLLLTIDLLTPGGLWFYWPMIGWGIWLMAHGASVFGATRLWGAEWEERKGDRILRN